MEKKAAELSLAQKLDQYGGVIALVVCLGAVICLLMNR